MGKTLTRRILAPIIVTGMLTGIGCSRTPDYTKDYTIFENQRGTLYIEAQDLDNIKSAKIKYKGKVVYDLKEEPFPEENIIKYIEPQELKAKGINPKDRLCLVIEDEQGKVTKKKINKTVSETLGDKIGSFFFNLLFSNSNFPSLGPY